MPNQDGGGGNNWSEPGDINQYIPHWYGTNQDPFPTIGAGQWPIAPFQAWPGNPTLPWSPFSHGMQGRFGHGGGGGHGMNAGGQGWGWIGNGLWYGYQSPIGGENTRLPTTWRYVDGGWYPKAVYDGGAWGGGGGTGGGWGGGGYGGAGNIGGFFGGGGTLPAGWSPFWAGGGGGGSGPGLQIPRAA